MNLTSLPNEILWIVASFLPRQRDLLALLMTCRDLHSLLIESLYHFEGQYHYGCALSSVVEKNNLTHAQYLLNGLRAAGQDEHTPSSSTDSPIEDGEMMFRRQDADYWEDVYTHPLYQQGYSIASIVTIQHALVEAVSRGYSDMVRLLLDRGARVNFYRGKHVHPPLPESRSPWRRTRRWEIVTVDPPPLFVAVKYGHLDLVKLLLQRGAKAELYVPSPLYRAVKDNRRDIAAFLLQHTVHSQHIASALKLAVLRGDRAMVLLLLDSGLEICEYSGPALYTAIQTEDQEIVDLLESRGATVAGLCDSDKENWDGEDGDGHGYGVRRRRKPFFCMLYDPEIEEEDEEPDS